MIGCLEKVRSGAGMVFMGGLRVFCESYWGFEYGEGVGERKWWIGVQ